MAQQRKLQTNKDHKCGNCKFCRPRVTETGSVLLCHFNPPVLFNIGTVEKPNNQATMPPVTRDFWGCSKYVYSLESKDLPKSEQNVM